MVACKYIRDVNFSYTNSDSVFLQKVFFVEIRCKIIYFTVCVR